MIKRVKWLIYDIKFCIQSAGEKIDLMNDLKLTKET